MKRLSGALRSQALRETLQKTDSRVNAAQVLHETLVISFLPQALKFRIRGVAAQPVGHQSQYCGLAMACSPDSSRMVDLRVADIRRCCPPCELEDEELIVAS